MDERQQALALLDELKAVIGSPTWDAQSEPTRATIELLRSLIDAAQGNTPGLPRRLQSLKVANDR